MLSGLAILMFTPDKFFSHNYKRSERVYTFDKRESNIKEITFEGDDDQNKYENNDIFKFQNPTKESSNKIMKSLQFGNVDEEKFKKYHYYK